MYKITDSHKLEAGNKVVHQACTKNEQKFAAGQPDSIIIHYTAGRNAESSAKFLCRKDVKASAHVVIGRDGKTWQLVPFDTISWHAGRSEYNGRSGYNKYSIGLEIDNAGILEKTGDNFVAWFGKHYPANEVMQAVHRNESIERFWHVYTEKQIECVEALCEELIKKYPTITQILGHEEIAQGRKQDPGPAFPLDKLRQMIFQDRDADAPNYDDMEGYVDVPKLNIRELPSVNSDTVTDPLLKDTKVKILQKQNGWYQVKAEIEGWVSADYVRFGE